MKVIAFVALVLLSAGILAGGMDSPDKHLSVARPADQQDQLQGLRDKHERDMWQHAIDQGAPVYRDVSCSPMLPCAKLPSVPGSAAIRYRRQGYVLALSDVAAFGRWYGVISNPIVVPPRFKDVRYVYEVVGSRLANDHNGQPSIAVSIHERRSGCILPACNPVSQLPNYERTVDYFPENLFVDQSFFTQQLSKGG